MRGMAPHIGRILKGELEWSRLDALINALIRAQLVTTFHMNLDAAENVQMQAENLTVFFLLHGFYLSL